MNTQTPTVNIDADSSTPFTRGWSQRFTFVFVLCLLISPAVAHNLDYSLVTLEPGPDQSVEIEINCHLSALLLGIEQRHLLPGERERLLGMTDEQLTARIGDVRRLMETEFLAYVNGSETPVGMTEFPDLREIFADALMTPEDRALSAPIRLMVESREPIEVFAVAPPPALGLALLNFRGFGNRDHVEVVTMGAMSDPVRTAAAQGIEDSSTAARGFRSFVMLGITHVVPDGWDHILFIIAMTLGYASWRMLVGLVTVFTLSHTVALALGVFGLVSVSGQIVEPMIALSIAIVALENIFRPDKHKLRLNSVAILGLLHGLGFAGSLQKMDLSGTELAFALFGFNVGVEVGQLVVVALVVAATAALRSRTWYRKGFVMPASICLAATGSLWAVMRVVGESTFT